MTAAPYHLHHTAADIDYLAMPDRIELLASIREVAGLDAWRNLEGCIRFFASEGLGTTGSWISWVNAGVLESVERGVARWLDPIESDYLNPGAALWITYLDLVHNTADTTVLNPVWSEAKEVSTNYGVALAELKGCQPTAPEAGFLLLARAYNWAMTNRAALDAAVMLAPVLDRRLSVITIELVSQIMDVGNAEAAELGCRIAWSIAQQNPAELSFDNLVGLAIGKLSVH